MVCPCLRDRESRQRLIYISCLRFRGHVPSRYDGSKGGRSEQRPGCARSTTQTRHDLCRSAANGTCTSVGPHFLQSGLYAQRLIRSSGGWGFALTLDTYGENFHIKRRFINQTFNPTATRKSLGVMYTNIRLFLQSLLREPTKFHSYHKMSGISPLDKVPNLLRPILTTCMKVHSSEHHDGDLRTSRYALLQ